MLEPKRLSKHAKKRIITYDMEWIPGEMRLRMVGVFDGKRYRYYEKVSDFLASELTRANSGAWFYAHFGGATDVQFILECLMTDDRYRVEGSFSGSSAVIVKIIRGSVSWYFVDSLYTIRASLKAIGEKLGMPKGEVSAWDCPLPELVTYNEQDCRILWTAVTEFQELLGGLKSEMRFTLASCAMRLIQRRYLKRTIPTSATLNNRLRPAYVGGRVEVFNRSVHSGWYYDINSCYPYAMTKPLPGRYLGMKKTLGDGKTAVIAEVTLDVPEMYVPPVPYMYGGSLYFPVGARRQWLCGPELQLAESLGCRIVKIHEAHHFQWFSDLKAYAEELYALRQKNKGTFYYELFKLLLNSGYGKFGEQTDKAQLLFRPTEAQLTEAKEISQPKGGRDRRGRYNRGFLHLISPGIFLVEKTGTVPHAHVPIAAYVTSYARCNLYEHMAIAPKAHSLAYDKPHYCDTDGFALSDPNVPTSTVLGGLKLEKEYSESLFHSPKLYHLHMANGEDIVRAKGFSKIGLTDFQRLIAGESITQTRMMRLKELYSRGNAKPTEVTFEKRLQNQLIPKRCFDANGQSRPWSVEELHRAHDDGAIAQFDSWTMEPDE